MINFAQHVSEYTLLSTDAGEAEGDGDCFASCSTFFDTVFTGTLDIAFEVFDILGTLAISLVLSCAYGGARVARSAANSLWTWSHRMPNSTGPLAVLDDL